MLHCDPIARASASDASGGLVALHQRQRQRLPQQCPSAPWPVRMKPSTGSWPCPLGIAGGRVMARVHGPGRGPGMGPRGHGHRPRARGVRAGLACWLWARGLLHDRPRQQSQGHGHAHYPGRGPPALSPCSCARATPEAGQGQGRIAPQRISCSWVIAIGSGDTPGACANWPPGVGPIRCPAASMEGGEPRQGPLGL